LVGALGLTLLGCSHSPPQLASTSPCDETGATNCDDAAEPAQPHGAPSAVKREPAAGITGPSPTMQPAAAAKASAKVATTAAGFVDAQASVAELPAKTESAAHPSTSRNAGRMAAATAEDKDASAGNPETMTAVVMARPEVKSVAELAGETVAIDDRYAQFGSKVRTAIAAAGATEVQLSEGRTTAMTRLSNGEVPAAVVALMTPEAAETFPAIAGYRIFHIPLSPRLVKPAR
jgi:hypothetical protein